MEHLHGNSPTTDHGTRGSLNALAFSATIHCFIGCAIGEVLGMALGTGLEWNNSTTIVVSIVLAFVFGYAFTLGPLLKGGVQLRTAVGLAFASDTLSISVMEIVDNMVVLLIPGAMNAGLGRSVLGKSGAVTAPSVPRRFPGQSVADPDRARPRVGARPSSKGSALTPAGKLPISFFIHVTRKGFSHARVEIRFRSAGGDPAQEREVREELDGERQKL